MEWNHLSICSKQDLGQNYHPTYHRSCEQSPEEGTRRISQRPWLLRPDFHPAKYRTVLGMAKSIVPNFIDFEKVVDSIHRDSLWRILRAYCIPLRMVNTIPSFYTNFTCSVAQKDLSFEVKRRGRQECVKSAILFSIVIDRVLGHTAEDEPRGIRWTLFSTLEDLDFADDLAILPHSHHHIQGKSTRLNTFCQKVELKISQRKVKS